MGERLAGGGCCDSVPPVAALVAVFAELAASRWPTDVAAFTAPDDCSVVFSEFSSADKNKGA